MNRADHKYRKAQSVLEYSAIIAIVAVALIAMQVYLRRGAQGRLQATGDQMADQYAYGLTDDYENFKAQSRRFEFKLPGWNHPTTIIGMKGSYDSKSKRKVLPLDEVWPRQDKDGQ